MSESGKFLSKMLDRLYASLLSGPGLNCRPHASRQRIDMTLLGRLQDLSPESILLQLLGEQHSVKIIAKVPPIRREQQAGPASSGRRTTGKAAVRAGEPLTPEQEAAQTAWDQQQALLNKLRGIVEDARLYTQDTGVHVLHVGFPLLSVPAGYRVSKSKSSRRILAPVAFIPVQITSKVGLNPSIRIECYGEGADLVVPNTALLAWIEQQTGKSTVELFADEEGVDPWRELRELVIYACETLSLPLPALWAPPEGGQPFAAPDLKLHTIPNADESEQPTILTAAVLGLFPMANQSLIRDMQEMSAQDTLSGPVVSFLRAGDTLGQVGAHAKQGAALRRIFTQELLVSAADPFQAQAVRLAREHSGLVIHGPPGTGKSQTIANIIGDHLARSEKVLLVCDKRTALDVVASRLQHLGLGGLYAVVHDPQRDKRDLYKGIREQLDGLAEVPTNPGALAQLTKVDGELQELHEALTGYYRAIEASTIEHGPSFHSLMGHWLALPEPEGLTLDASELGDVLAEAKLVELEKHESTLREIFERGQACSWPTNPWADSAGISLGNFMAKPMERWRLLLAELVKLAQEVDATLAEAPPFGTEPSISEQAKGRLDTAEKLSALEVRCGQPVIERWANQSMDALRRVQQALVEAAPVVERFHQGPLDAELAAAVRDNLPPSTQTNAWIAALDTYLEVASKWYSFVYASKKSRATEALSGFGLSLSPENAGRLKTFLLGLRARQSLVSLCEQLTGEKTTGLPADDELTGTIDGLIFLSKLLLALHSDPALASIRGFVLPALALPAQRQKAQAVLQQSAARAEAIALFEEKLTAIGLFTNSWRAKTGGELRRGAAAQPLLAPLVAHFSTLETLLRLRDGLLEVPETLASSTSLLLQRNATPEQGLAVMRKGVLAAEITRHIRKHPQLHGLDETRLQRLFDRYRALDEEKKRLTREVILHRWKSRQKERLLASTGTRLNNLATELRRRLMLRGERAMRLRQVIHSGQGIDGGDPLFDICPVWMTSPETVAQIFPRSQLFDVVIFDEASQCRLEEALPVLMRGKRVVIAGDPQQLPPSRFFEAAVAVSNEEEPETDQELFEQQQGEIEDLLNAALNLEIQQCYLDVHYRSRDPDLIEFSNEYFYESRLQPIPAHPSRQKRPPAIRLVRADGTYAQHCNEKEAEQVCQLVRELLSQEAPPSIGIACFNISQRDLIVEYLDRAAAEDADFAARLTAARSRVGAGSFEGLFVKNLENVQGDERDHMIISTTYGPDPNGRFFRRFGPLGRSGGGRRLNVLVTRARDAVHLITSIPSSVYRSLPNLPAGSTPSGAFLLFAYLQYAEGVAEQQAATTETKEDRSPQAATHILPASYPSEFAQALGAQLAAQHAIGSSVQWGNDGFCIDVAVQHPADPENITLGVLCDGPRFAKAPEPVEWDVFRVTILERQGWKVHRLWTPHFFRDPDGAIQDILNKLEVRPAPLDIRAGQDNQIVLRKDS